MTATPEALDIAQIAAQAAADRKAASLVGIDVSETLAITDIFVIASATNERQVGAIVDRIEEMLIAELDLRPTRREGDRENRWVLLDYIDVVIHVQHAEERELYSLERLWRDCPVVDLGVELEDAQPQDAAVPVDDVEDDEPFDDDDDDDPAASR